VTTLRLQAPVANGRSQPAGLLALPRYRGDAAAELHREQLGTLSILSSETVGLAGKESTEAGADPSAHARGTTR
jgi:hypothetical protein